MSAILIPGDRWQRAEVADDDCAFEELARLDSPFTPYPIVRIHPRR